MVSVRLKSDPDGKVVQVKEDTLKDNPGKYEVVEKEDAEPEKAPASEAPKEEPKEQAKPKIEAPDAAAAHKELQDAAKNSPELRKFITDFQGPKNPWRAILEDGKFSNPDFKLNRIPGGLPFPDSIKTLKDLDLALKAAPPAPAPEAKKPGKKTKAPKAEPEPAVKPTVQETPTKQTDPAPAPAEAPAQQAPAEQPAAAPAQQAPAAPQQAAPPAAPPETPSGGGEGKPEKGKKPEKPKLPSGQPTRPVSRAEVVAAEDLIVKTFPAARARALLAMNPPMHPDEMQDLARDYHLARSVPTKDLKDLRERVSKFYATSPEQAPVPKTATKNGKTVPLDSLPPEEQAREIRKHQMRAVALTLAAESAITKNLMDSGTPSTLAQKLASNMLTGRGEPLSDRFQRGSKEAETLFYDQIGAAPDPVDDSVVRKTLEATDDPMAKQLAVGYFQAADYNEARAQFLDPKSPDHISEQQSSKAIAKGLIKASDFLRKRGERYPEGTTVQDTALTFRTRVMRQLATLLPEEKLQEVQASLDEADNKNYEADLKKFEKAAEEYKEYQALAEQEAQKLHQQWSAKVKQLKKQGKPFDLDPPLGSEDLLVKEAIYAPTEPPKPPRYDLQTKKPQELQDSASQLWDDFMNRQAGDRTLVARVAVRFLFGPFSTYSHAPAMGHDRQAVYLGIKPNAQGPYVGWQQPQACELGDRDFTRILTAAREWLRTPVLSTNIEGIVRDTQLRAALDLAISTENYGAVLHPTLYNNLLARLAGEPQDETLLTVRNSKTARTTMPKESVELKNAQADHFIAGLDRLAATVQEKYESWGMKFAAAKDLVLAIDKLADEFEKTAYGDESLTVRAAEVLKTAEVLQRDSDEKYMDTFKSPTKPIQTEADEPYMRAYADDDTSGVHHGKSETGRPLAP